MSLAGLRSQDHYKAAVRELRDAGLSWREEMGSKHARLLISVNGREEVETLSITPSDWRTTKTVRSRIRRRIKQWAAEATSSGAAEVAPAMFPTLEMETMDDSTGQEPRSTDVIEVLGRQITKVEYKGQRVVTLRQIDEAHERPEGTAGRQFRQHRERFIEGIDCFEVGADEIRRHLSDNLVGRTRGGTVFLLTERGYGKIVKGWNDDLSWQLHDAMQDAYFAAPRFRALAGGASPSDIEGMRLDILSIGEDVGRVEQALSKLLTLEEWRQREHNALKWFGEELVAALSGADINLSKKSIDALLGGQKNILGNKDTWRRAGMMPMPVGDEFEYRSADELLCEIMDTDAVHSKLPAWVSTNILIPHAREQGWPQRQSERRSRSHRTIVLFPMLMARAHVALKPVRDTIIRQNAKFWDVESAKRRGEAQMALELVEGGRS